MCDRVDADDVGDEGGFVLTEGGKALSTGSVSSLVSESRPVMNGWSMMLSTTDCTPFWKSSGVEERSFRSQASAMSAAVPRRTENGAKRR